VRVQPVVILFCWSAGAPPQYLAAKPFCSGPPLRLKRGGGAFFQAARSGQGLVMLGGGTSYELQAKCFA
jgi:hypothetical protein